jgi:archaeal type IV pilus assembly protein PilA
MNFRKIRKNFRRNQKAISPVIATLLMIAIAVVASLVTYAWVMGYMGFTTNKTGLAIQIQSVSQTGTVYVQNVGNGAVSFAANCVYVDGIAVGGTAQSNIGAGATVQFAVPAFTAGTHSYTIKVTSMDGTFSQIDKIFPP